VSGSNLLDEVIEMAGLDPREELANLIDFDAFRAEQEEATIPVKVGGVIYRVPASPPASAVLDAIRLQKADSTTIEPEDVFKLAAGILGVASEAIIRDGGLSIADLMTLLNQVANRQSAAAMPPPNRETRRAQKRPNPSISSPPGRGSRRTSSVNTASTSAQV
jgi:hypothetical protein